MKNWSNGYRHMTQYRARQLTQWCAQNQIKKNGTPKVSISVGQGVELVKLFEITSANRLAAILRDVVKVKPTLPHLRISLELLGRALRGEDVDLSIVGGLREAERKRRIAAAKRWLEKMNNTVTPELVKGLAAELEVSYDTAQHFLRREGRNKSFGEIKFTVPESFIFRNDLEIKPLVKAPKGGCAACRLEDICNMIIKKDAKGAAREMKKRDLGEHPFPLLLCEGASVERCGKERAEIVA